MRPSGKVNLRANLHRFAPATNGETHWNGSTANTQGIQRNQMPERETLRDLDIVHNTYGRLQVPSFESLCAMPSDPTTGELTTTHTSIVSDTSNTESLGGSARVTPDTIYFTGPQQSQYYYLPAADFIKAGKTNGTTVQIPDPMPPPGP